MKQDIDYSGKNILVVGGSSGIGNGIAQAFRAHGGRVHVWGTKARAADYAGAEGSDFSGLGYTGVDVSDAEAIASAAQPFDELDVLVLSQGTVIYRRGEFEREGWERVMAINLDSLMNCARKFKEELARRRGTIIIVSSVSGLRGNLGNPAYAASKAGAISLTKSLAQAWAVDGIRVNGLAPGLVSTKLTKVTVENPKRLEGTLAGIAAGRMGTADDMANAALFLASPMASYIYGHTLVVDGGMTL